MSRISTNLSGIERTLLNRLAEANAAATLSSLRMATGEMINAPRDDPSGFVYLSGLQSQLSRVQQATDNATAAASMVSQAQTAADAIRTQLGTIRTELLKWESGTLTGSEQSNIDAAITEIENLVATEMDGKRLLDGSANFEISGRHSGQVTDLRVFSIGGATVTVSGSVTAAATRAELTFTGSGGNVDTDATFTLTGETGSYEFTVTSAQTLSALETAINDKSHKTGVTASVDGDLLTFTSVEYGTDAAVTISVTDGTFIVAAGNTTSDTGTDATATINSRSYTGDGHRFTVNDGVANYRLEFEPTFTGDFDTITVSGDALTFALSTDPARSATLAIPGLHPAKLGGLSGALSDLATGGSLAGLGDNASQAIRVVDEALADLTEVEGAIDGFYNASITSASNFLADIEEDLESAIDEVNLVDDTEETARETYYTTLASNSIAGLSILQSQRAGIVTLIQKIAGLI